MSTPDHSTQRMRLARDEAAEWFIEFRVGDVDALGRRTFNDWLRRSPENIRAYLEIAGLWSELPAAHGGRPIDVDSLIAQARAQGNVVALDGKVNTGGPVVDSAAGLPRRASRSGERSRFARPPAKEARAGPRRTPLLVAAAVVILGVAVTLATRVLSGTPYETRIGEQRFISLADGSTINLNAHSRVRVRFTKEERRVELISGQALFQVAKDRSRPFIVRSDSTEVRAVGTLFDVYRRKNGTQVTVVEGRVAVEERAPAGAAQLFGAALPDLHSVFVSAGEQVDVRPKAIPAPRRANIAAATAWTQHRLVFEAARLADVVEEFNRYNVRPILIAAGPLEEIHISGVYASTDPSSLITFLRAQPGIVVVKEDTEIRILPR